MKPLLLFGAMCTIFFGCQPVPSAEELYKDLLVQTDYVSSVDFTSYSSFTLPIDTLGLISNNANDTLILGDFASSVSAEIKSNMEARGYAYVDKSQNPDLGVNAFVVSDFSVFQTINYPSYYGGYYSPYYGYYYPVVNTYINNSAILIIQLVDLNKVNQQGQFQVIWTSTIGDIIASPDRTAKSVEAINQAFAQSPVIGK